MPTVQDILRFLSPHRNPGYLWATAGLGLATTGFWLLRHVLDKGQASLLYLPVVIACALRFGFGPAVFGAVLSFFCWDFFFLPPLGTLIVADPRDWLSLGVFLVAAVSTAQLASQARIQTAQARAREAEIALLFEASETLSREVRADRLLLALSGQMQTLCQARACLVFRRSPKSLSLLPPAQSVPIADAILQMAESAAEQDQAIGFGGRRFLWDQAVRQSRRALPAGAAETLGVYLPLHADGSRVGVLYVGPRQDGRPFSAADERLIRTLANHAAVVIARDALAAQAAQAQALREADLLKDSLLSLVSHELRTPLAAIKASATGLLQPDAVWDLQASWETLSAINTEADRLTALVSNLLDLSRLEAGAWQPRKDWCDLVEIIGTALDRLPDAEAGRVEVLAAPDVPLVQADYTQIALVLTNLLENAVKYTPPGTPIFLCADAAPAEILLTVRDFGSGLVPGEEARLFERFFRGQAHQNSTVHGTGLGLALCRAIVEAHGGTIRAASAPAGQPSGAVFTVVLPLIAGAEAGEKQAACRIKGYYEQTHPLHPLDGARQPAACVRRRCTCPPPPSFTSKVSVSPAAAKAGKAASVSVSLSDKSKPVAGGNVDLEVYNAQGKKVGQQVWSGQALSGAKSSVYHWSWKPAAPGIYTLKLGIFTNGWKTLNYWVDKALIVKVS